MVFSGRGLGDKVRMSANQIQGLNILEDAEQLFVSERADLADRILERLSQGIFWAAAPRIAERFVIAALNDWPQIVRRSSFQAAGM